VGRRESQRGEYGQYEAAVDITTPSGALAYAVGHPVPASNVEDDGRVVLERDHDGKPTAWTAPDAVRWVG
jgi:hypothetical protein